MSAVPDKVELFDSPGNERALGLLIAAWGGILCWAVFCGFPASTVQQVFALFAALLGVVVVLTGLLLFWKSFRPPTTLLRADENGLLVLLGRRTNSAPVHITLLWNCIEELEFFGMGETGYGLRIRSSLSKAKVNNIRHNQIVEYIEKGESLVFPVPVLHWLNHDKKLTEHLMHIRQQALSNSEYLLG